MIGLVGVLRYVYGLPRLDTGLISRNLVPVSLQEATAFLLLAAATVLREPRTGALRLLRSDGAGGVLARRLILPVIGLPVLLGYVRLRGRCVGSTVRAREPRSTRRRSRCCSAPWSGRPRAGSSATTRPDASMNSAGMRSSMTVGWESRFWM